MRNLIAGAIVSFVHLESAGTQVMLLLCIFFASLSALIVLRPWRTALTNNLDISLTMVLLLLLCAMGTSTVVPPSLALSVLCATGLAAVLTTLLSIIWRNMRESRRGVGVLNCG